MASQQDPAEVIRFGEFEADPHTRELLRDSARVRLPDQSFEVLLMLLQSPGQLVTREDIRRRLWSSDTFVDFDHGLNNAVKRLRDALEDSAETPKYIETLPRRGYRFVGTVAANGDRSNVGVQKESTTGIASARKRTTWVYAAGTLVLALTVAGFWIWRTRTTEKPAIRTIAVLPFANLSGDAAQDYFADGMTDELITLLAKNRELRVISRTSIMRYKNTQKPLPDIARELGVDGILEGSVARSGNHVHVRAQLIFAQTDSHLWAESYDRDVSDVAELQTSVAQTIARQVGLTVTPSPSSKKVDPEAHDAYLLGRFYWFADNYPKSREYFRKAIDLQPDYAAAWSGLADAYTAAGVSGKEDPKQVMPLGDAAARKAVELDDTSAEAHHALAAVYLFYRWDWAKAQEESTRSLELNPSLAEGHHLRGYIFRALNRTEDDVREQKITLELDPFARPWALCWALIGARQYDAAIAEGKQRSELQPNDQGLYSMVSNAYWLKGMDEQAVKELIGGLKKLNRGEDAAAVERAFKNGGRTAVFKMDLEDLNREARKRYISPLYFASVYASMRDADQAVRYLQQAYDQHMPHLVHLQSMPVFDFLHSDPRYRELVKKIGLPPAY